MFSKGSYITYGTYGACKISDIRKEDFSGCGQQEYYILQPVSTNDGSKLFVPTDNELLTGKMRHMPSAQEIHSLIESIPEDNTAWIDNSSERKERFKEVMENGDHRELIAMIKCIHDKKSERIACGKKLWISDENTLAQAEKILYNEFALVLDIRPEDVLPFINEELSLRDDTVQHAD